MKRVIAGISVVGAIFIGIIAAPRTPEEGDATHVASKLTAQESELQRLPEPSDSSLVQVTANMLDALKSGDGNRAMSLLTGRAREAMLTSQISLAPPGSDRATYEIENVEMTGPNTATVFTRWIEPSNAHAMSWHFRRENEVWRINGFSSKVFRDRPDVVLNFEHPKEMLQTKQHVDELLSRQSAPTDVREIRQVSWIEEAGKGTP